MHSKKKGKQSLQTSILNDHVTNEHRHIFSDSTYLVSFDWICWSFRPSHCPRLRVRDGVIKTRAETKTLPAPPDLERPSWFPSCRDSWAVRRVHSKAEYVSLSMLKQKERPSKTSNWKKMVLKLSQGLRVRVSRPFIHSCSQNNRWSQVVAHHLWCQPDRENPSDLLKDLKSSIN